jgi:predicted nucleic acid-binding protein
MQKLLVDTAAWTALELANDHNYSAAFEFRQEAGRTYRWVTTHAKATQFYERVWQSASLDIVQVVPPHETLAWDIFRQYVDKKFSAVDCISFAVMKTMRITSAFTFDHHFRQAGFQTLPVAH